MSDLISRQAAIETAKKHWYKPDIAGALAELPSAQPDRKTSEWLHEYLQTAVDFCIITETQASRLMEMIAEDNT